MYPGQRRVGGCPWRGPPHRDAGALEVENVHRQVGAAQWQRVAPAGATSPLAVHTDVQFKHLAPDCWAVPSTARAQGARSTAYVREDLAEAKSSARTARSAGVPTESKAPR
jgi:hypothetical protein